MRRALVLLLAGVVGPLCLYAQTPAPRITGVTDAAAFGAYPAAEGYISVFGANLADGIHPATGIPYSSKLGTTEIFVCPTQAITSACLPAGLTYVSPTQINAVLTGLTALSATFSKSPVSSSVLETYFIARVNGALDSVAVTGKSPITFVSQFRPAIFIEGYDCSNSLGFFDSTGNYVVPCTLQPKSPLSPTTSSIYPETRGAVTDVSGNVVWSGNPAKLGGYYSAWLTGLGRFTNGAPPGAISIQFGGVPFGNSYEYAQAQTVTAPPLYAGPSSAYPGLYQINFQIPTAPPVAFACGSYDSEIDLTFEELVGTGPAGPSYVISNLVNFPLAVRPGDPGCIPCHANGMFCLP